MAPRYDLAMRQLEAENRMLEAENRQLRERLMVAERRLTTIRTALRLAAETRKQEETPREP